MNPPSFTILGDEVPVSLPEVKKMLESFLTQTSSLHSEVREQIQTIKNALPLDE
ncbi:hypothetical protein BLNAU_5664 [Blattamonas nauphoetae]|uniref:Uncharacterized protein n=1 Tax=Blattamonas nauphoetae TaxID=2049346 RepID=A0ABQ9Y6I3_9EUKA|nr:hypothetical protein BLNAU_5664 [Blattamonas nauphoetae]